MKIEDIDVNKALKKARELLEKEAHISSALKSVLEVLFVIITLLINRLNLNSKNSSKPPSSDPNREKNNKKNTSSNKPGGQKGYVGKNLKPVEDPDEIETIPVDRRLLPIGKYHEVGYQSRQVITMKISRYVIEYRAQILEDAKGVQYVAAFPENVTRPVQYGSDLKAHSVYLSQFQLLPYNRINNYFSEEIHVPVSTGAMVNFNKEAYELLEKFEEKAKLNLLAAAVLNVDETGINVNGEKMWLHVTANDKWTYFFPHKNRGSAAMNDIGILPNFTGVLCHDHWKPYYVYQCLHSLCNAHHLRELQRAFEQDNQQWAFDMKILLIEICQETKKAGNQLEKGDSEKYYKKYTDIIEAAERECPLSTSSPPIDAKKSEGK